MSANHKIWKDFINLRFGTKEKSPKKIPPIPNHTALAGWLPKLWIIHTNVCIIRHDPSTGYKLIIESVDSICRDSADHAYMIISQNLKKTANLYKPL